MTIDLKDKRLVKRLKSFRQDWQVEAWAYYRTTPLVGFGSDFIANAMSRLRFYVAWQGDVSDWPNEIDPTNPPEDMDLNVYETAVNILTRLDRGQGLTEMARKCGYGLTLPGEVVVLGREDVDPLSGIKEERFDAYSTSEVDVSKADRGEIFVKTSPSGSQQSGESFKIDPASAVFFRIWRPDPEFGQLAATPMQRVLEQCEEQGLLRRYMRGSYRSRLNAGVFEVPKEWKLGPDDNRDPASGEQINKLQDDLVTAMMTAVGDEGSAATVVPFVIHAPQETLGKARHITFDRTFDDRAMEMRRRLDEEIASGLDLPDQVLLGLGDVKFRNAEVITKEQFKLHLEPLGIVLVKSLTAGFMLPMLIADGVDPALARQFTIWFDSAAITSDPDQSASSNFGYDRGLLSGDAWLKVNSYVEEDKPSDEEIAARRNGLPWPIIFPRAPGKLQPLGEAAPPPQPAPPPPDPSTEPPPEAVSAAARLRPVVGAARRSRPAVRNLGRRLAVSEQMCRMKVQMAADQSMRRGMERIGAAARTRARDVPQAVAAMRGIDNAAIVTHLGVEMVQRLGVDPQHHLDIELARLHGRFRELVVAHQHRVVSMLAQATGRPVGPLTERSASSWARAVDHAWGEFEGNLNKLVHDKLFLALVSAAPGHRLLAAAPPIEADARLQGEFDATLTVPAGLVREALSIAGGTTIPTTDDPSTLGGVIGGPIVDDLMSEVGVGSNGYTWLYGDSATRTRPFQDHEDLDGIEFLSYDDDQLAKDPGDFPYGSSWYYPGDHEGCQCDVSPQLVERQPAVYDPVAPRSLEEKGLDYARSDDAELAKSRNPDYVPKPPQVITPKPETPVQPPGTKAIATMDGMKYYTPEQYDGIQAETKVGQWSNDQIDAIYKMVADGVDPHDAAIEIKGASALPAPGTNVVETLDGTKYLTNEQMDGATAEIKYGQWSLDELKEFYKQVGDGVSPHDAAIAVKGVAKPVFSEDALNLLYEISQSSQWDGPEAKKVSELIQQGVEPKAAAEQVKPGWGSWLSDLIDVPKVPYQSVPLAEASGSGAFQPEAWQVEGANGLHREQNTAGFVARHIDYPEALTRSDAVMESFSDYQGSGYSPMNNYLRKGVTPGVEYRRKAELMQAAVLQGRAKDDMVVYRGISSSSGRGVQRVMDALQNPGDVMIDKGLISTSVDRPFARSWGQLLLEIEVPEGRPVLPMLTTHINEGEIMLPAGAKFEFMERLPDERGIPVIRVRMLPDLAATGEAGAG